MAGFKNLTPAPARTLFPDPPALGAGRVWFEGPSPDLGLAQAQGPSPARGLAHRPFAMHRLPPLLLADPDATRRLGQALGRLAQKGDVLWLSGGLGAGKTSLSKGLGEGLGVAEALTSPTFSLLHEHQGRLRLSHADLYRLSASEVVASGLEEAWLAPRGVAVVEWPEVLGEDEDLRPEAFLWLRLSSEGEGRRVAAEAEGARAAAWWAAALSEMGQA